MDKGRKPADAYKGVFFSPYVERVMRAGSILSPTDSPSRLLTSLIVRLAKAEASFSNNADSDACLERFFEYVRDGKCVLGSPLLTNISAGIQTLSSCAAAPVAAGEELSSSDLAKVESYYELNMGSGFDLSPYSDPVSVLEQLNDHASRVDMSGSCERYVGNMAHLSVAHPSILEFAGLKVERSDLVHFNLSVDVNEQFMAAVRAGSTYLLSNGHALDAHDTWKKIVKSAWACGDPGIISMDRYNATNPLRDAYPYTTTAPCAEVGLSPGESCVFGYINVAACATGNKERPVDLEEVGNIAECLVRILDDALESGLNGYPSKTSENVMTAKRKIGVSICGFADLLLWSGIPYGFYQSQKVLCDILGTVNLRTKRSSASLASERGPFGAFEASTYNTEEECLARFKNQLGGPSDAEWDAVASQIKAHGLRNVMTTALPPSGRSALLLGVTPSIEPMLSPHRDGQYIPPIHDALTRGLVVEREGNLSEDDEGSVYHSAAQLSSDRHLAILKVASEAVDDGVSKTINLPASANLEEVSSVYAKAWDAGLKAISVYRIGSRN